MRREVTWAQTHTGLFVPSSDGKTGVNFGSTKLHAGATGADRNLKMFTDELGLIVHTHGQEVLVPWANVVNCVFKPSEKVKERSQAV